MVFSVHNIHPKRIREKCIFFGKENLMPLQASVIHPQRNNQNLFQCAINTTKPNEKSCKPCTAHKANGQPCKLKSCYEWKYCWVHLLKFAKVRIAESTIKIQGQSIGLGLFARTNRPLAVDLLARLRSNRGRAEEKKQYLVFKKNEIIGNYQGEIVTKEQLDQRYDYKDEQGQLHEQVAPYAITSEDGSIMDALCKRNFVAYANDPYNSNLQANSTMNENTRTLIASRNIWQGEEILWNYGAEYWQYPIAKVKIQKKRRV